MSNGTLSPVFNIRGMFFTDYQQTYNKFNIYNTIDGVTTRNYITYNEDTGIVYKSVDNDQASSQETSESLENVFGVVRIESGLDSEINNVIGIKVEMDDKETLL